MGWFVWSHVFALAAGPNAPRHAEALKPPTTKEIRRVAETLPGPVFWFGASTEGQPLSEAAAHYGDGTWKTVSFIYGVVCEELDAGSGPTCPEKGAVSTSDRRPSSLSTSRASCWVRVGQAWLIDCPGQDADSYGPRLLTGRRVVRFARVLPGETDFARPWRQTIGQLRRYDHPGRGAAALPATKRTTRTEFAALGSKARAALPSSLRP